MNRFRKTCRIASLALLALGLNCCKEVRQAHPNEGTGILEDELPVASRPYNYFDKIDHREAGRTKRVDLDQMLDDYEVCVLTYLAFHRKAMAGDQEALTRDQAVMEKTMLLQKKIYKASETNELSTAQRDRMTTIQNKLLHVLQ